MTKEEYMKIMRGRQSQWICNVVSYLERDPEVYAIVNLLLKHVRVVFAQLEHAGPHLDMNDSIFDHLRDIAELMRRLGTLGILPVDYGTNRFGGAVAGSAKEDGVCGEQFSQMTGRLDGLCVGLPLDKWTVSEEVEEEEER